MFEHPSVVGPDGYPGTRVGASNNTDYITTDEPILNGGSHTHSVDVPATNTTNDPGNHIHSVSASMASFASQSTGSASVDVTMPYVQLLLCRKD
jgi:hypothetical protein